jgi:hypothetical protein
MVYGGYPQWVISWMQSFENQQLVPMGLWKKRFGNVKKNV